MIPRLFLILTLQFMGIFTHTFAQVRLKNDTLKVTHENGPLRGLTKLSREEMNQGREIMLDPSATPFYREDFSKINEQDFMTLMLSGDYMIDAYQDNQKIIKAFVMRKATAEEKSRMPKIISPASGNNPMPAVGEPATPFNVQDMTGKTWSLESLKGKVVVLNFWFVECKPCIMEMPELNKLTEKFSNEDVVFLGIATNKKEQIESFLQKRTFQYRLIPDSRSIAEAYRVMAYPTHMIIDKNSLIQFTTVGLGPNTISELEQTIEKLTR